MKMDVVDDREEQRVGASESDSGRVEGSCDDDVVIGYLWNVRRRAP